MPAEAWPGISQRYLERVTYDLLSNAVHHGQRPISIEAFRENGDAHLIVGDAGGWAARPEHFQAFFQQDMSETRARGGFGLGLFLASRLCQAAGGELTVERSGAGPSPTRASASSSVVRRAPSRDQALRHLPARLVDHLRAQPDGAAAFVGRPLVGLEDSRRGRTPRASA